VICGDIVHKENKMTMINILGTLVNRDQVNYIGEYDKGDDFSIGIKFSNGEWKTIQRFSDPDERSYVMSDLIRRLSNEGVKR
jgi:hypothetical protein